MRARRAADYRDDPETGPLNHPGSDFGPLFVPVPYQRDSDTSEAAAAGMQDRVTHLRRATAEAYAAAGASGLTADECAARLQESVLAIRPRVTELFQLGTLEDTGHRRQNASGMTARVLRAKT